MVKSDSGSGGSGIPEGYVAVPVSQADASAPLRLCVLVRKTPEPGVGQLVLLRDLPDAGVYLGCVADRSGRAREWIELWVQNIEGLEASLPGYRESFSNAALDARWEAQCEACRELAPESFIQTGWESVHPPPCYLDLSASEPVHPGTVDDGGAWELCQDDQALRRAGLPSFSTSLARYLYQPSVGEKSRFIPAVTGVPHGDLTAPIATVLEGRDHQVPFNPQAGLIMARSFAPVEFEDYADLLGGKPWGGLEQGKKHISFAGAYRELGDPDAIQNGVGHIFLGRQGRAGRFVETFHLKLQLLADAFQAAHAQVQRLQLPFLNLSADSFRVALKEVGTGLPFLWTANCALVKPSHAFALPVQTSELRYFIRARSGGTSIYLPEGLSAVTQGQGSVRIRKLLPPDRDRITLEGTLVPQEAVSLSQHDLLWLRVPLPDGRVDLYGHAYAEGALAPGEIRFRTVPQKLSDASVAALRAAEGVSFARAPFEVVPLLSSPCDLYSLGVLAVRALVVDEQTTLAIALDEVLSLARQLAAEYKADVPLGTRVRTILEREARYADSLGPHRLARAGLQPDEARQLIPTELWCDVLGLIVSLFPATGPDSFCRDYGDVPALALETVFNQPIERLMELLVRSRSLIVIDWAYNREIGAAIKGFLGVKD